MKTKKEVIEEVNYLENNIILLIFLCFFFFLALTIILSASYYSHTEMKTISKVYKFTSCDTKVIDLPPTAKVTCSDNGILHEYYDKKVLYGCLEKHAPATCVVKIKYRAWKVPKLP